VESGLPGIPVTAPADAGDDDGDDVRLALIDPPAERTTLDGAWWPRTRSLTGELPALVEELHRRGIRVTRAAYNPDGWDPAPRRLAADGRIIRLGWFRSIDPQLLNLTGDFTRGRIDLLVVPPDTPAAAARAAFTAVTARTNRRTPSALLAAVQPVGPAVPRPRPAAERVGVPQAAAAAAEQLAVWDSEGGQLHPADRTG
jgi:hypothetical protein